MDYRVRTATLEDQEAIRGLIAGSIRELGAGDYTRAQIDAALQGTFGLDTTLIRDGTYYVATTEAGLIAGCGGWSGRRTLFGSDVRADRDDSWLDPSSDAAKIRAFFVDPRHARRGLGRKILERSEAAAARAGFTTFELLATLPGVRLYSACGYQARDAIDHKLANGLHIRLVPMVKHL